MFSKLSFLVGSWDKLSKNASLRETIVCCHFKHINLHCQWKKKTCKNNTLKSLPSPSSLYVMRISAIFTIFSMLNLCWRISTAKICQGTNTQNQIFLKSPLSNTNLILAKRWVWPHLLFVELLRYHSRNQMDGFHLFKSQSCVSEPSHLLHHCLLQLRKYSRVLTKRHSMRHYAGFTEGAAWNHFDGRLTRKGDIGATVFFSALDG